MSPGLGQDSLRRAVRDAGIEAAPVFFEAVGSTNTEAIRLAEEGAPGWTVVATNHQTAGRGRLGRTWTTPPGRALTFSLVLRPALPPERAPLVSLLAAAEMAKACREVAGVEVACKWPNDLLVGERKVAGILAEAKVQAARLSHVVLGVGVNVTMEEADLPPGAAATSLALEGGSTTPAALLQTFLRGFREAPHPEDPDFAASARSAYRERCATLGRRVRAITTSGEVVEGTALDVDEIGGLVTDAGSVAFGEVEHLD